MDQEIVVQPPAGPTGSSVIVRTAYIAFFALLGLIFSIATAWQAPRFWYVPTAVCLLLSAGLWFRPRLGASASFPFCLILSYMMLALKPWAWPSFAPVAVILLLAILAGTVVCILQMRRNGYEIKPMVWSVALLILALAADLTFTNRVEKRPVEMSWTADGTDPTGDRADLSSTGEKPVILFTPVAGGYCTDTIYSEPLRQKLTELHKPRVHVIYNEFRNFGRVHGYNVGSVEGMVFNEGQHVVTPNPEGSGGILVGDKATEANPDAPATCPR